MLKGAGAGIEAGAPGHLMPTWFAGVLRDGFALDQAGVAAEAALLVAVHPWDIDGARRAGLGGAWLRRGTTAYPAAMTPPTMTADDLIAFAGLLADTA